MYECMCSLSPEEGPGSFEAGVTGSSGLPSMSAVLHLGLLQELYMLITAEASLQTLDPILFIYLLFGVCLCSCAWMYGVTDFYTFPPPGVSPCLSTMSQIGFL